MVNLPIVGTGIIAIVIGLLFFFVVAPAFANTVAYLGFFIGGILGMGLGGYVAYKGIED